MHRAVLKGRPLDKYASNYCHTEYCEHSFEKKRR